MLRNYLIGRLGVSSVLCYCIGKQDFDIYGTVIELTVLADFVSNIPGGISIVDSSNVPGFALAYEPTRVSSLVKYPLMTLDAYDS